MESFDLVLAACVVTLGATVQGVSGVGGGFLMVPLLAMIDVRFVPGPMVFATLALSMPMAWRERAAIDTANLGVIVAATLPGALAGAWVLESIPPERLGFVFGGAILLAIAIVSLGLHPRLTRRSGAVAGFVAGSMGASAGIGAPPLAVLYHRQAGPVVRSTLAVLYTVSSLLIVSVLTGFGRFGVEELRTGLLLMPGMVLGYMLSRPLTLRFDRGPTRYVVLVVSAAAAATLVVRSL